MSKYSDKLMRINEAQAPSLDAKAQQSALIEQQTAEYLARGNTIVTEPIRPVPVLKKLSRNQLIRQLAGKSHEAEMARKRWGNRG